MPSSTVECALCARPTRDLCAACGVAIGRDHGAQACPGCGHRSLNRARTVASAVPRGVAWGAVVLILTAGGLVLTGAHLVWRWSGP